MMNYIYKIYLIIFIKCMQPETMVNIEKNNIAPDL